MKKLTHTLLLIIGLMTLSIMVGCGPAKVPPIEEIEPHETVFLVPLEGASKDGQAQFMSIQYLEDAKVAAKRVTLPVRERSTGRMWFDYEWLPTMKVIKVDRKPVTREWTQTDETGTSAKNEAITVESQESIEFAVGVNITTMVTEEDAATFLYYYTGKTLAQVTDENVRGYIQSGLSREFGSRFLEVGRKDKKDIFDTVYAEARVHFKEFGITIANMGLAEGLTYKDPKIQESINAVFEADMDAQETVNQRKAQQERNGMNVEIAVAKRKAAQEFAKAEEAQVKMINLEIEKMKAQAALKAAETWNGQLPANIMPEGNGFLMNLNPNGGK